MSVATASISEILDDLRAGRMIVLLDDEQRENEGDLICAAEHATPDVINFMLREGRGMLFVAVDGPTCERLDLTPPATVNTSQRKTNYTISVDAAARFGITTGVSASDRATTIQRIASPDATPTDFDRPGHVPPVRARDGGVLVRAGHTEGIVDLCRLAGLQPAGVGIEVMREDGTMARGDDLQRLCQTHNLNMCSVADVIHHRLETEHLVTRVEEAPFRNALGDWRLIAYSSVVDDLPHVALVCGDVGQRDDEGHVADLHEPVLVRMHSQNLLGDVFGDASQPTCDTLAASMRAIQNAGRGAIVYLRHDGMGAGLLRRLQSLRTDASHDKPPIGQQPSPPSLNNPPSKGAYGIGCQILRDLGVRKLRLLTNHPFHPTALAGFGLEITEFVPVSAER